VLDVGGWDFYRTVIKKGIPFDRWTVIEPSIEQVSRPSDPRVEILAGDGCALAQKSNFYDTVISIQVLEHVYEPNQMFREIVRVLKPGGKAIIMFPQTANLHMAPHHYFNFTHFWGKRSAAECGVEIVELTALGGFWSTIASRLFMFFFQGFNQSGMVICGSKRSLCFYLMFPLMLIFAAVTIPICMLFSWGDLPEEANNHLLVIQKPLDFSNLGAGTNNPRRADVFEHSTDSPSPRD
jgi:SAM-dependent methyltransferase